MFSDPKNLIFLTVTVQISNTTHYTLIWNLLGHAWIEARAETVLATTNAT